MNNSEKPRDRVATGPKNLPLCDKCKSPEWFLNGRGKEFLCPKCTQEYDKTKSEVQP